MLLSYVYADTLKFGWSWILDVIHTKCYSSPTLFTENIIRNNTIH